MKLVKQEGRDCVLVTLAMLGDLEYSKIQDFAYSRFPVRIGKGYQPYEAGIIWGEFGFSYPSKEDFRTAGNSYSKLDFSGKGILITTTAAHLYWHIVAYEKNRIFDGLGTRPVPVEWYFRSYLAEVPYGVWLKVIHKPLKLSKNHNIKPEEVKK